METAFKIAETKVRITADNDAAAREVRNYLKDHGVVLINLMASPGAGKTTTLVRTINALKEIAPQKTEMFYEITAVRSLG